MNTTCVQGRKFWLVFNTYRKETPQRKHWNLEAAVAEATRLSSLQPQDEFLVLSAECVIFQPSKVYTLQLVSAEQMSIQLTTHLDPSEQKSRPNYDGYPESTYDDRWDVDT